MFRFGRPELYAALCRFGAGWGRSPAGLVLAAAVLGSAAGRAQGPADGAIAGTAVDAAGHAVEASVAIRDADGRDYAHATAARDGRFLFPHLPVGDYTIHVAAPGSNAAETGVTVLASETVEVRAVLRAVPAGSGIQTAPGATAAEPLPEDDGDELVSGQGLPPAENNAVIDGAAATQAFGSVPLGAGSDAEAGDPEEDADANERTTGPGYGLGRGRHSGAAYGFARGAVREFGVVGLSYSAQTGHSGSETALTISQSGTGRLHGSAFFDLRSQAFAAHEPLAFATSYLDGIVTTVDAKPHDLRERFGGTLGGPVPLRRLHRLNFFYALDVQRRGFPAISSPADPNFYNLSAVQTALLENRGVSSGSVNTALNYVSSLTGEVERRADQTIHFGRVDWAWLPALGLGAEYNRVRWTSPAGLNSAPVVARGRASLGNAAGSVDLLLLRVTGRIAHGMTNEARISYVRDLQYETPQRPLAQESAIVPGGNGFNLAPEVNIGPNGLVFGTPATVSREAYPDESRVGIADTWTLLRGHHLIQAGGDVSSVQERVATLANAAGTFHYDSGTTNGKAGGLVDFITDYTFNVGVSPNGGCPSIHAALHFPCFRSFAQSFGESTVAFSTADLAGFLEDTWRARAGLTIHAGARYEYTLLPLPQTPNASLDAVFGTRGATGVFPEDRNNVGPRVSVAVEPFGPGRGTVRAGYGIFFGRLPGATIQAALSDTGQAAATTRVRIRPTAVVECPQAPGQGFGYLCAFLGQPPGVVATTTSAVVFDRRFRLPAVQQASLAVERAVRRGTSVSARYVLNLDRQLPGSVDLNIAPSTTTGIFQLQGGTGVAGVSGGETFVLPVYTGRLNPSFGPVTDIVSDVNATYHALVVAGDSRFRSVRLHGTYVWSKALDFGPTGTARPRTNGHLDPFTDGYDKGISSLNFPWAVRANAVWTPRVDGGADWLRRLADGWEVASIVAARAGRPYSLNLSGGTSLPGGHLSANGSGGALYLPTVGRNTLRLPATYNVDLRASRGFRAGAKLRVYLAAEAFNLLNHRNVSSLETRAFLVGAKVAGVTPLRFQDAAAIAAEGLNTLPFGTPTAAGTSLARERQVEFSLRAQF